MDSATEGVVLVSFGSVLQGSQVSYYLTVLEPWDGQVPPDKQAALLEAFGGLKERVLWKWEADHMEGKGLLVPLDLRGLIRQT